MKASGKIFSLKPPRHYRPVNLSNQQRTRKITRIIRYADKKLRKKYPLLKRQDGIGLGIFLFSITGMLSTTWLFAVGILPAWAVIPLNGMLASLLHELEHDIIHGLYYKDRWVESLMMWGIWIFRSNTVSGFYRKEIHLHHHRVSGQRNDIEEQFIGNGMRPGFRRILVMIDQHLAYHFKNRVMKARSPEYNSSAGIRASFPVMTLFYVFRDLFILRYILELIGIISGRPFTFLQEISPATAVLDIIGFCYILPNIIRQASLQIISSNMHYFGDVTPGKEGLIEQTQVLKPWYLIPFQMFCFNFGSTHGIHHIVVNQPFYLRQVITPWAHPAMKKYGVRFNDTATYRRANRYNPDFSGIVARA